MSDQNVKKVDVTVYYLQMLAHAQREVPPPRNGLSVVHAIKPPLPYYRFLYHQVGQDFNWSSRRNLTDNQLLKIVHHPQTEVQVLHVDGNPAGFAELDRRKPGDVEMVQFGLMGPYIGQGLGTWFLQWMIDHVWRDQLKRFWLHTCTLDHPAALHTYQKAGFELYKEEQRKREL